MPCVQVLARNDIDMQRCALMGIYDICFTQPNNCRLFQLAALLALFASLKCRLGKPRLWHLPSGHVEQLQTTTQISCGADITLYQWHNTMLAVKAQDVLRDLLCCLHTAEVALAEEHAIPWPEAHL